MHIVHTESSQGWGGQELRILSEAAGMRARGHELTIIASPAARIFAEARRRGLRAVSAPIERKSLRGFLALRGWLRRNAVDVVNTHSSTDSWLTALACATLSQAPAVVRTRHVSVPVPNDFATRWLYQHATRRIVTTGEALRDMLIQRNGFGAQRIVSVPTGVDVEQFAPGDKAAARKSTGLDPALRYIGIVATLRSWKGHLHLIEALQSLPPEVRLLIIGEGPMRLPIESRVAELALRDRVMMAGHQEDPAPWLQALDVFCLPSYANEGVPQALMQAMLTGLPIVTTPVGGIPEAVEDGRTALLVPPRAPAALAGAIARLLDDAQLAARLGEAARHRALRTFSRDRMLDCMERLFLDVVRERASAVQLSADKH